MICGAPSVLHYRTIHTNRLGMDILDCIGCGGNSGDMERKRERKMGGDGGGGGDTVMNEGILIWEKKCVVVVVVVVI